MVPPPTPMPPLPPVPLTLIVATTPTLGIGLRGTLPWPPLKADLAFFARVTKRPPHHIPAPNPPSSPSSSQHSSPNFRNAVIMGRKTWESIPPKFRPLKGRINVVVSRRAGELGFEGGGKEVVLGVGSIEEGVRRLQTTFVGGEGEKKGEGRDSEEVQLGRVFVIGGAEIYAQVLRLDNCKRILWTRLRGEWECDTFFPEGVLPVEGTEGDDDEGGSGQGWVKKSREELEKWVGEEDIGGLKKEGEVEFEVCMYERQ